MQSHLALDSSGVEHLLLHFYVTSSPVAPPSSSWFDFEDLQWDWDWTDVQRYTSQKARDTWDAAKKAVAYISGTPLPSTSQVSIPAAGPAEKNQTTEGRGFFGLFRGLRGGKGKSKEAEGASAGGVVSDCGEVHVDFIKVCF